MPIGTTPAYNGPYTANGATTVFPFTFKVLSTSQVSVINRVSGVDTTVSSGLYTVTLSSSSPSSGSVVFNTAPASGEIYVLLTPEFSQDIEFADGAAWIAKPVNDGYDQSALRDQALKRDLGRAMLVPVGETTPVLPVASERAGQYLAYDTNGDPVMSSGTGADSGLRADLASTATGKGAALIGAKLNATGAAARTQDSKNAETVTPEDFGAVGDWNGTTGTDNTTAFANLAAYINANSGHVILRGKYRITQGFVILKGTWEFIGDALVRNTSTATGADFWQNTAVFIGTYFGYNAVGAAPGMNAEPTGVIGTAGFAVSPVAAGATSMTTVTAADAANFPVGAKVYLLDANNYGASPFAKASHMSIVETSNSGTGVVTFRDPVPFAIDANGGTNPRAYTPSGTLPLSGANGLPSGFATLAENVTVINGAFESADLDYSQVVHISCHDCDLDFRWISGRDCIGANPVSDTRISVQNADFTDKLFELAYYHFRVNVPYLKGTRVPGCAASGIPPVSLSEYGHTVTLGVVDVSDLTAGDVNLRGTVGVTTPLNHFDTLIVRNAQNNAVGIGSAGLRGESTRINRLTMLGQGGVGSGLLIDCDRVSIGHVSADDMTSSAACVRITSSAGTNVFIDSARLGTATASGAQYRIADQRGITGRKALNRVNGNYAQAKTLKLNVGPKSSSSSGVDFTADTHTVTAATSGKTTGWRVVLTGNIPATGAAASRTVKIVVTINGANVTLGTVTMTSAQSGQFCIEGTIRKLNGDTATKISGVGRNEGVGTITPSGGLHTNSMATYNMTVNYIVNTNTADSIVIYEWGVTPFDDEAEPA